MAEFVDVLRQFDRMCKANAGCFNCPLHEPDGVSDRCSIGAFVNDSKRIEREVMQWAAEHPEPVYPAWRDWLRDLYGNPKMTMTDILESPIDPEIAQRLNIVPRRARNGENQES